MNHWSEVQMPEVYYQNGNVLRHAGGFFNVQYYFNAAWVEEIFVKLSF